MPFGSWLASTADFHKDTARRSIDAHEAGLDALFGLAIPSILRSRPIWDGRRLANEAFSLEKSELVPLHRKSYFPSEPRWEELAWFGNSKEDFMVHAVNSASTGVLVCTEAMFNEHARSYGVQGAALVAIPRATGIAIKPWLTAGAMAALVSGSFVASSNRVGHEPGGGHGSAAEGLPMRPMAAY